MSLHTTIRQRAEALELKMSRGYVMSRKQVERKGYTYLGSIATAADEWYYTARACKRMGKPVSGDEFAHVKCFAMFKSCYQDNCLHEDGKSIRPCLPVFYRGKQPEEGENSVG